MTKQTKISNSEQLSKKGLTIVAVLAFGLLLSACLADAPLAQPKVDVEPAIEGDIDRFNGLSEFYSGQDVGKGKASDEEVDYSRFTGLSEYYSDQDVGKGKASGEAVDYSRFNGLSEFYSGQDQNPSMNLATDVAKENAGGAAVDYSRFTGLSEYYSGQD